MKMGPTVLKLQEGLFTGVALSPTGHKIYLGFEKLDSTDQNKLNFWENYSRLVDYAAKPYVKVLAIKAQNDKLNTKLDTYLNNVFGTLEGNPEYDALMVYSKANSKKILRFADSSQGIGYAQSGFGPVLDKVRYSSQNKEVYMVYASTTPIVGSINSKPFVDHNGNQLQTDDAINMIQQFPMGSPDGLKFFKANYGHLIMSMGCVTQEGSVSTTHMGIMKNPIFFIDPENKHTNTSVIFHGFAAQCASQFLGKTIQVNQPAPVMIDILVAALGKEAIYTPENLPPHAIDHCHVGVADTIAIDLDKLAPVYLEAASNIPEIKEDFISTMNNGSSPAVMSQFGLVDASNKNKRVLNTENEVAKDNTLGSQYTNGRRSSLRIQKKLKFN